jgi:hypothetical protein
MFSKYRTITKSSRPMALALVGGLNPGKFLLTKSTTPAARIRMLLMLDVWLILGRC